MALDVTKAALAMSGGPVDFVAELKSREDKALVIEIVYAATAAWTLRSNAQQHLFIEKIVREYIADNPSPAAMALAVLLPKESQN